MNRGIRKNSSDPMVVHVVGVERVEAFDTFTREIVEFGHRIDPKLSKFYDEFCEYVFSSGFDQFLDA